MITLFWGSVLFLLAFILHLIIWRIKIPKEQISIILKIFFGTLIFAIIILCSGVWPNSLFGIPTPKNFPQYLHISLFFTSFTFAYIYTYTAWEAESPSITIITMIAKKGSKGLPEEQLHKELNDDLLVKPRIKDLIRDKMVILKDDRLWAMPKGLFLMHIVMAHRKLMKITHKGG